MQNPILKEIDELLYTHPVIRAALDRANELWHALRWEELTPVERIEIEKIAGYREILSRLLRTPAERKAAAEAGK